MDIGTASSGRHIGRRRTAAFLDPTLHLVQVPDDAARGQVEPSRELASLLHLVDGRVGERHDLAQLRPTDRPLEVPTRCRSASGQRSLSCVLLYILHHDEPPTADQLSASSDYYRCREGAFAA